jgi:hypothetical protein
MVVDKDQRVLKSSCIYCDNEYPLKQCGYCNKLGPFIGYHFNTCVNCVVSHGWNLEKEFNIVVAFLARLEDNEKGNIDDLNILFNQITGYLNSLKERCYDKTNNTFIDY